jgi:hypothetical protein
MFIAGDVLYSYGHHFPLLVRWHGGYLLNADKYSVTTSAHQSACFNLATLQVAFSALSRAGLPGYNNTHRETFERMRLLDKTEDRWDDTGRWYYRYKTGEDRWGHPQWRHKQISNADKEALPAEDQERCHPHRERRPSGALLAHGKERFLSSMDGWNYFITLLPTRGHGNAAILTVANALDALVPFEAHGRDDVKRQGEWFFVPANGVRVPRKNVQKWKTLPQKVKHVTGHHRARDYALVCGTRHPLVRGTIRHDQQDHGMLKLGEQWHTAIESRHRASWGASGAVD